MNDHRTKMKPGEFGNDAGFWMLDLSLRLTTDQAIELANVVANQGHDAEAEDIEYAIRYLADDIADASYTCDECGRTGNIEDGIEGDSTECPDEECSGTVHVVQP